MTGLRTEEQAKGQRVSRGTARHRRIMFSATAGVCASFGQPNAEIVAAPRKKFHVQISRSEKVRDGEYRR